MACTEGSIVFKPKSPPWASVPPHTCPSPPCLRSASSGDRLPCLRLRGGPCAARAARSPHPPHPARAACEAHSPAAASHRAMPFPAAETLPARHTHTAAWIASVLGCGRAARARAASISSPPLLPRPPTSPTQQLTVPRSLTADDASKSWSRATWYPPKNSSVRTACVAAAARPRPLARAGSAGPAREPAQPELASPCELRQCSKSLSRRHSARPAAPQQQPPRAQRSAAKIQL